MSMSDVVAHLIRVNPYEGTSAEAQYAELIGTLLYPHDGPVTRFVAICRALEHDGDYILAANALDAVLPWLTDD